MHDTSFSLLERISRDSDPQSWRRLLELYSPLLQSWLRRYEVQPSDADDLVQEVLLVVVRELPDFRHSGRPGAFRSWLRNILANRLQNYWRTRKNRPLAIGGSHPRQRIDDLQDDASHVSRMFDSEHDRHVIGRLLEQSKRRFEGATWQAFERLMIDGVDAQAVAAELGLTPNAVYIAKSRVLAVLRLEAAGLVD
jgi:RNA polymerase sigma-70 factor (ECF subfamily)